MLVLVMSIGVSGVLGGCFDLFSLYYPTYLPIPTYLPTFRVGGVVEEKVAEVIFFFGVCLAFFIYVVWAYYLSYCCCCS